MAAKNIKVTLAKSLAGQLKNIQASVRGLGLRRRHQTVEVADTPQNRERAQVAYTGGVMPPPEAVEGKYAGPRGEKIRVAPLTDEDRRTLVRWIDLGCPIDLDYNPSKPEERLGGSIAAHLIAARAGANIIRTHDVAETLQALRVAQAIEAKG